MSLQWDFSGRRANLRGDFEDERLRRLSELGRGRAGAGLGGGVAQTGYLLCPYVHGEQPRGDNVRLRVSLPMLMLVLVFLTVVVACGKGGGGY